MTTAAGPTGKSLTYADAGVDIDAAEQIVDLIKSSMRRTHGPRVFGAHGGFAGMFRLDYNEKLFRRNYRDPVLVACADGVGTKIRLAIKMGVYNTVGIDCVAMNINDLIVQGAEPLFFLDYLGLHRNDPTHTAEIVEGVARGCEIAGCALLGGETAEMPDIYAEGDFDLAGFGVGVVPLRRAIDPMRVETGDVVIGLASSGVHSNGFTLVNRIIDECDLDLGSTYDELDGGILGEVLLEPTRIYARYLRPVHRDPASTVQGQTHRFGDGAHHRRRAREQPGPGTATGRRRAARRRHVDRARRVRASPAARRYRPPGNAPRLQYGRRLRADRAADLRRLGRQPAPGSR